MLEGLVSFLIAWRNYIANEYPGSHSSITVTAGNNSSEISLIVFFRTLIDSQDMDIERSWNSWLRRQSRPAAQDNLATLRETSRSEGPSSSPQPSEYFPGTDAALCDPDGEIFIKPCTKKEIEFYESAINDHHSFAELMPAYMGGLSLGNAGSVHNIGETLPSNQASSLALQSSSDRPNYSLIFPWESARGPDLNRRGLRVGKRQAHTLSPPPAIQLKHQSLKNAYGNQWTLGPSRHDYVQHRDELVLTAAANAGLNRFSGPRQLLVPIIIPPLLCTEYRRCGGAVPDPDEDRQEDKTAIDAGHTPPKKSSSWNSTASDYGSSSGSSFFQDYHDTPPPWNYRIGQEVSTIVLDQICKTVWFEPRESSAHPKTNGMIQFDQTGYSDSFLYRWAQNRRRGSTDDDLLQMTRKRKGFSSGVFSERDGTTRRKNNSDNHKHAKSLATLSKLFGLSMTIALPLVAAAITDPLRLTRHIAAGGSVFSGVVVRVFSKSATGGGGASQDTTGTSQSTAVAAYYYCWIAVYVIWGVTFTIYLALQFFTRRDWNQRRVLGAMTLFSGLGLLGTIREQDDGLMGILGWAPLSFTAALCSTSVMVDLRAGSSS